MGAYASTEAEDGEAQYHGQGMTHDPRAPRVDPETSARHNANRVHEAVYIPDLDVFGAFMDFAPYFPGQSTFFVFARDIVLEELDECV